MGQRVNSGRWVGAIISGEDDLADWDDEELRRGKRRNKNGGWSGRPPKVVPKMLMDEWVRRQMRKGIELLQESTEAAVQVLVDVAQDSEVDANTRVKAAELILDRTLGKPRETMSLDVGVRETSQFEQTFRDLIVYEEGDTPELQWGDPSYGIEEADVVAD